MVGPIFLVHCSYKTRFYVGMVSSPLNKTFLEKKNLHRNHLLNTYSELLTQCISQMRTRDRESGEEDKYFLVQINAAIGLHMV